ncbi:VRR-NUC domain-containing protein [Neptunomonas concharum]|uniref:VRR-NUC domain-containing protein n=1 Tax=Neptunomonas concharum TaxID=1031538 RepID=A0A5P1RAG0_9GAMM|nr:VRR-NUC domain-containing protein [Neptunomonas concharum]QEQ96265.1 VRR-NUC domain-containing protein [Neptunomonas concharum]
MRDREGSEQAAFFNWLRVRHPAVFDMAYHVPNGGSRKGGQKEGARLKAQGVKAGVPDICIAIPRGGYFGLYIEFKATPPHNAVVSVTQKAWLEKLASQGYKSVLCKGFDALKAEVEAYLSLPVTRALRE